MKLNNRFGRRRSLVGIWSTIATIGVGLGIASLARRRNQDKNNRSDGQY